MLLQRLTWAYRWRYTMRMDTKHHPEPDNHNGDGEPCPHCGQPYYSKKLARPCSGPSPAEQQAHLAAELAKLDASGAYLGGEAALAALRAGRSAGEAAEAA